MCNVAVCCKITIAGVFMGTDWLLLPYNARLHKSSKDFNRCPLLVLSVCLLNLWSYHLCLPLVLGLHFKRKRAALFANGKNDEYPNERFKFKSHEKGEEKSKFFSSTQEMIKTSCQKCLRWMADDRMLLSLSQWVEGSL